MVGGEAAVEELSGRRTLLGTRQLGTKGGVPADGWPEPPTLTPCSPPVALRQVARRACHVAIGPGSFPSARTATGAGQGIPASPTPQRWRTAARADTGAAGARQTLRRPSPPATHAPALSVLSRSPAHGAQTAREYWSRWCRSRPLARSERSTWGLFKNLERGGRETSFVASATPHQPTHRHCRRCSGNRRLPAPGRFPGWSSVDGTRACCMCHPHPQLNARDAPRRTPRSRRTLLPFQAACRRTDTARATGLRTPPAPPQPPRAGACDERARCC